MFCPARRFYFMTAAYFIDFEGELSTSKLSEKAKLPPSLELAPPLAL